MTRFTWMRITLLVLVGSILVAASVQAKPVKLAVLLPFSNIYKRIGIDAKEGFLLGIREEAAALNVGWKSWITLDFLDTRTDKDHSLQLAKDAISGGAKAILGCSISGIGVALQDYALNEARVPFIVFGGCVTDKLRTIHPLFIRITRSFPLQSVALAHWLTEYPIVARNKPRWACIHTDRVYGVGVCDAFKRAYGQVGQEVGRVPVPLKTVRMKKEIVRLAKLKPDFALAVFVGGANNVFFRDYYRFKIHQKIPLVALNVAVTPARLQSYEKTLEKYGTGVGLIASDVYMVTTDLPANKYFVSLMQQNYNKLPSFTHMWGYDAGRLLIKALAELHGQWDGAKVVQLMKTLPYISPRQAQPLQFDSHSDAINGAYVTKTKRDGDRLVREIVGEIPPINMDEVLK